MRLALTVLLAVSSFASSFAAPSAAPAGMDASQPIPFYIEDGSGVSGYDKGDPELAELALRAWSRESGFRLHFVRAETAASALLQVRWVSPAEGHFGEMARIDVGGKPGARVHVTPDTRLQGEALARAAASDRLLRDSIVYLTCVHEIGHALGLAHTAEFADIMYSFQYGGDILKYFLRYREKLGSRADIVRFSGLSSADAMVLKTLYSGAAEEVRVAAASDLQFAIREMAPEFQKATGHTLRVTLGSSGNFYAQISNGAPFDVFLSADANYPRRLEQEGRAEKGGARVYGVGRIALWVPQASGIDLEKLGMNALESASIRKIAIANPDHAPYGRAAVAAMEKSGVYERVRSRLVMGENIAQAAQFAQSGAADIGVVALSLAMSDAMKRSGRYWIVPSDLHPPLEQAAALLKGSPGARAFVDWLQSAEARTILRRYGFQ
ncbi:MAG TPA: molybdate ABC transporter substrate-binding protein [Terriglobia bacterium]|nr:molybdate ABC transporter substrate-binding protein [Terriglobia bacterium]